MAGTASRPAGAPPASGGRPGTDEPGGPGGPMVPGEPIASGETGGPREPSAPGGRAASGERAGTGEPALRRGPVEPGDAQAVERLLGRPPAGSFRVAVRRPDGAPVVIENEPWLGDGTPMPTRFWLVDPELRAAVSRLESDGGVRRAAAAVAPAAVAAAHDRYAAGRRQVVEALRRRTGGAPGPVPAGGVGGTRRGVKCLHAHVAWHLSGGDDPVGAWAAQQLGLDPLAFHRTGVGP